MSTYVRAAVKLDRGHGFELTIERYSVGFNERASGMIIGELSLGDLRSIRDAINDALARHDG